MPRDSAPTPRRRRLAASTGVAAVALTVKPRAHRAANGDVADTRTPQRVQAQVVARGSRWAQTVAALALSDVLAQRVTRGSDHAGRTGLDALKALCDGASPDEAKALRRMLFDRAAPTGGIDPDLELAPDWRKGAYPYRKLMSRRHYERQKYRLQVEQLRLQAGVKETGQRVAILFEGRNAAGKGAAPPSVTWNT